MLVTLRLAAGLRSLRAEDEHELVLRVDLGLGASGLPSRRVQRLNKLWQRKGQVFPDRYHARALTTPREVRNALVTCS